MSKKKSNKLTEEEEKIIQAKEDLWREGILSWKLQGKQKDIYSHFKNLNTDIIPVLISRQFGKSYTMCSLAIEVCLNKPNAIVKYVCPTSKMVVNVMVPRVRDVIADCPVEIKPKWYPSEKKWIFPNGSEIQVAGTENGNYDTIRGGSADLCIVDEAAFCSELETVVFSVLAPTTDTTGGKIYLASTPNDKNPQHDFHELFVFPYEATGKLLRMTWEDSPMVDDKQRERILKRYPGGEQNIKFRCEYLCEIPEQTESNIIPEFAAKEKDIVKEVELPDFCDFYTSMDVGFRDLTVGLFGYYDTQNARLVVLDEYVVNGSDVLTDTINKEVRYLENMHYIYPDGTVCEPYLRIMDNDLKLINDLAKTYGLKFIPTEKHGKEQAVDTVRRWVEQERIIIHPRCVNLIYHIKNAQWRLTRNGTYTGKFKHLKGNDQAGLLKSHADALDALIYMVRNIKTKRNPYPEDYGYNIGKNTFVSPKWKEKNKSQATDFMRKLLNLDKKK